MKEERETKRKEGGRTRECKDDQMDKKGEKEKE